MIDFSKVGKEKKNQTKGYMDDAIKKDRDVAVRDPLDLETARKRFEYAEAMISAMAEEVKEMVVENDGTAQLAVQFTGRVKTLFNKLEAERKEITKPALQYQKAVKALADTFTTKLKKIEKEAKAKIGDYQYKKELERRKEEERQRKAREELQKKVEKEAKEAGVEAPKFEMAPPIKEEKTVTRAEDGTSAFIKKPWKGTITDPTLVPREYCEPSQKLINQAVKQGIREIPGVEIKQEIETSIRL
jgi:hypothetical protein